MSAVSNSSSPALRLNIIGCGKLGTTVAKLMTQSGLVSLGGLYSRNITNAENAALFCASGSPCATLNALPCADLWLLSVPDDAIQSVARQLAQLFPNWNGTSVFHCSGIHSSELLAPLQQQGANIASLHPIHSFADPLQSLTTFAGTCCTLEGDNESQQLLTQLFTAIGARIFPIDGQSKALYHTATAMASNYLVGLMDISLTLLEKSGIAPQAAKELLAPLVMQTAANIFAKGPAESLTGPIVRGDRDTVATHLQALQQHSPELLAVYRELGLVTLKVAQQARPEIGELHDQIEKLLSCT